MTYGPGKYDDLCTYVREQSEANAVIVIIVGGNKGHGFSAQADELTVHMVPEMLERVAREMRGDMPHDESLRDTGQQAVPERTDPPADG